MSPLPRVWTPSQRRCLAGLLFVLFAGLAVARWRDPTVMPDPSGEGRRAVELSTRLDPNTATVGDLSAIPGLGEAKARAIVEFRDAYARRHGGRPPFHVPRDLLPIKGVGVSTVENLQPYLTFPEP